MRRLWLLFSQFVTVLLALWFVVLTLKPQWPQDWQSLWQKWRSPAISLNTKGQSTAPLAQRVFDPTLWQQDQPLRVVLIGTDFEVRVWETLLSIPMGRATTYSDIARKLGKPQAARAVGAAVGKNPISFVVPCHRVLGRSGAFTGYHWGVARKQQLLARERDAD